MNETTTRLPIDAGHSSDADLCGPYPAFSGVLTGSGELRRHLGAGPSYAGHIVIAERMIVLEADVADDERGRFFAVTARLDPAGYTQTELDELPSATSSGAGFGAPARLPRIGPLVDDPIPFAAS